MTKQKKKPTRNPVASNPEDKTKYAARCALLSETNASAIIETFGRDTYGEISGQEAYELLHHLTHKGNTIKVSERMLLSQAHALDVMFTNLARRAASNIGCDRLVTMESYMRLALRAQNQARMTLESLATIKNPPVVFAKQANIANNQQVNNGEAVSAGIARARETENRPNKLLEAPNAKPEWMDAGATGDAAASNSPLEAVAAVNRSKGRKG